MSGGGRGRLAAQLVCLGLLLGTRVPNPDPWLGAAAAAATALVALAVAGAAWPRLRRLAAVVLPGAVFLVLVPPSPTAPLAFLPWMATAVLLVLFLDLSIASATTRAPAVSGAQGGRGSAMRWAAPIALLGAGAILPLLLPFLIPAPLAALHELRLLGALVAGALLAAGVAGVALLRRFLGAGATQDAGEVAP